MYSLDSTTFGVRKFKKYYGLVKETTRQFSLKGPQVAIIGQTYESVQEV